MEFPETHMQGNLSLENWIEVCAILDKHSDDLDFGIQVSQDGRVWVCINGIAWLRFKPHQAHVRSIKIKDDQYQWLDRFIEEL